MFDEEAEAKLRALHRQLQELEEKRKEIIGQIERLGLGTGAKAPKVAEAAAPAPKRPEQAVIPELFEPPSASPLASALQAASAAAAASPERARDIGPVTSSSRPLEKVALFRSLFRGREDIYALRWESLKTGKSGYQPVCKNDWIRGLCRRPQVRCAACSNREFVPVTDRATGRHLFGAEMPDDHNLARTSSDASRPPGSAKRDFVMGVYPLLEDETCWFLAADFDKKHWPADIAAFRQACLRLGVLVAFERSRSGNGAHAWLFFAEPIPAPLARRLGCLLLTEAIDLSPEIGLDSYDRLFPSQDIMPDGGFGNLIALPLQHRAASSGNSLFIDEDLTPVADQWSYLSSLASQRITRATVEGLVEEAARKGNVIGIRLPVADDAEDEAEPWRALPSRRSRSADRALRGPFPPRIPLVLANTIYIDKALLTPALQARLIRLASFQNPEFYKAQALRLSTFGKPRIISCAEDYIRHISLPRGCLDDTIEFLTSLGIEAPIDDKRISGTPGSPPIHFRFMGTLRPEQEQAVAALLPHDTGILAAATAFGKTVVAARMIAARAVPTLVLVHRRQLLDQWAAQLKEFLGLAPGDIGVIGSGKRKPSGRVDIALIQSLCRKGVVDDIVQGYGHLIIDECHHIPAVSFEQIARRFGGKYVLGLSATVTRKDGHHPIIFMQCGPARFRVGAKQGAQAHPFNHKVVVRLTGFDLPRTAPEKLTIQEIYDLLINDEARNELIFEDVMQAIAHERRSPVLITERRDHLEMFAERFRPCVRNVVVFKGGMGQKQREQLRARLTAIGDDEDRLLIATGRYLGEGFDDARLDTLFLTLPISWKGTLAQYAGRLHRLHYNKREVRIYDYADLRVEMLERMFRRRLGGYRGLGYEAEGATGKGSSRQAR